MFFQDLQNKKRDHPHLPYSPPSEVKGVRIVAMKYRLKKQHTKKRITVASTSWNNEFVKFYYLTTSWREFRVLGEVKVVLRCHVVVLMRDLNVHIENITINTHILLIQPKIYHKFINKTLTDYLSPG